MFTLALFIALIVSVSAGILDLVSSRSDDFSYGQQLASTAVAMFVNFWLLTFFDWLYFFKGTPVFAGIGWLGFVTVNVVITAIVFGVANLVSSRISATAPLVVIGWLVLVIFVLGFWNEWPLKGDSNTLGHLAHVTRDLNVADYPPTDDNHMVIVSEQNAMFKANQAMNQDIPGSRTQIGSIYDLQDCVLQSVDQHMYYICGLGITGSGAVNQRVSKYTVPGYIVVDAENPSLDPQARLTYKMKYTPGAPYEHSLTRHIYNSGYRTQYIDDLTLEVDDNWRPFYTASIDRPAVRWQQSVPYGFITADPQTGAVTRYDLQHVPSWVDRVYSAAIAKDMLNWWGQWGAKPWNKQGTSGRYKVDGNVTLVYTTSGPAWQALMTSQRSDTSIAYVALMDTRSTNVRMYTAPEGLIVQSAVTKEIDGARSNLKGLDPTSLALHEIYGEPVWVAPLVNNGAGGEKSASFAGLALLSATDPNSSDVIIGDTKGDALSQLSAQIASGSNNAAPQATSQLKSVTGVIAAIQVVQQDNQSSVILMLRGDSSHVYIDKVDSSKIDTLQLALAKTGDSVTLGYVDNNAALRNISSFTLNSATHR